MVQAPNLTSFSSIKKERVEEVKTQKKVMKEGNSKAATLGTEAHGKRQNALCASSPQPRLPWVFPGCFKYSSYSEMVVR
jgi:hypothetical protein